MLSNFKQKIEEILVENMYNRVNFKGSKAYEKHTGLYKEIRVALAVSDDRTMTKEEYLEWRDLWRSTYSAITDDIRTAKSLRKPSVSENFGNNAYWAVWIGKVATDLLELRAASKTIAARSYRNQREAVAA